MINPLNFRSNVPQLRTAHREAGSGQTEARDSFQPSCGMIEFLIAGPNSPK